MPHNARPATHPLAGDGGAERRGAWGSAPSSSTLIDAQSRTGERPDWPASPERQGRGTVAGSGDWGCRPAATPLRRIGQWPVLPAALLLTPLLLAALQTRPAAANGQVQLVCTGTLLEARGQAEQLRSTARLRASLSLEAEAATADGALGLLQTRLAAVRSALQNLNVKELRVTSPSTWQRPREAGRAASVQANLQVSGYLEPARLQALIRNVGSLPGVRLSPVETEADRSQDARIRSELLDRAYRDALEQVQPLADRIGRSTLVPLEIRLDGQEMPGMPMRSMMAADAAPPFDPAELNKPRERLSMLVRFCAR